VEVEMSEGNSLSVKNKHIYWVGAILLVGVLYFTNGFGFFGGITGSVIAGGEDVVIPVSDISETAEFYEVDSGGKTIRFFAVKAKDGSIKTAFDACDVCYSSKKGYRQEGDYMVCNNCGNRYLISQLGTENLRGGGCWPGYLPSSVKGGKLVIKSSDIAKGEYRF